VRPGQGASVVCAGEEWPSPAGRPPERLEVAKRMQPPVQIVRRICAVTLDVAGKKILICDIRLVAHLQSVMLPVFGL
jgi:hypothetical protein